jgi:glycosyltransferase involved in cell wall biosynthesis
MLHVEAAACGKAVLAMNAMGFRDTMVHGETALLAAVAQEIKVAEAVLGEDHGLAPGHRVVFPELKTVDYRADVTDVARHLLQLLRDESLRRRLGEAGRRRAVERFAYRTIAQRFVDLASDRLGIR